MDRNMEYKIRKVMSSYYKRKWAGAGICAIAIIYLIYLGIFKMDYRISLVVGGFASLLLTLSVFLVYITLAAVMIFVLMSASTVISETLMKDCDPYLFEACLNRLTILFYKDRIACNHAMAQYYQGNFAQAWETLQRINIYKLKGRFRFNYYVILCALHFRNGTGERVAELEKTYRAGIRNKKDQEYFRMLCADNNLFRAMENRDYESAFRFVKEREELAGKVSYPWHRVLFDMKEARIYAAMGENESAKLKLRHVVERGGSLFCVEEAKGLLEKITGVKEVSEPETGRTGELETVQTGEPKQEPETVQTGETVQIGEPEQEQETVQIEESV